MFNKWRVWNPNLGHYHYWDDDCQYTLKNTGGLWALSDDVYGNSIVITNEPPEFCVGNFNGVDVYQGDIIYDEIRHRKGVVRYLREPCAFISDITDGGVMPLSNIDKKRLKVIGNHRENPELLK